jgi:hypothetical protein
MATSVIESTGQPRDVRQTRHFEHRREEGATSGARIENLLTVSAATTAAYGPGRSPDGSPWSIVLRNVEEIIDQHNLRNQIATARDRAGFAAAIQSHAPETSWDVVRLLVVKAGQSTASPRNWRVAARAGAGPFDRDPVPNRYSELVRRYYEELER